MSENKTTKYVLYAIGEILLVVIGILIALQINNTNEKKKAREFELKMLNEVRNELIKDTIYFKMIKGRAENMVEGAEGLIQYHDVAFVKPDSIEKYSRMAVTGFQYIYHKGAYEAIKSTGIDKISNDSIRNALTDLYDFTFPRVNEFLELTENQKDNWLNELKRFVDFVVITDSTNIKSVDFKPKETLAIDDETIVFLVRQRLSGEDAISRLNNTIRQCETLLALLDKELNIEDVTKDIPINDWNKK